MKRYAWLVVGAATVLTTTGCQDRKQLTTALAEAKASEAEKDSLLTEVLETTQFVSDMNAELAKAKGVSVDSAGSDPGVPGATADRAARGAALDRLRQVITRLNESETKLAETEKRAKQSRQRNARLLAQIETFKTTIADLRSTAEQQKAQYEAIIADQQNQIVTLNSRVDTLAANTAALTDTVANLTSYKNTVYYAVGTKDELMKKGVVVKEGSKFLFFGGTRLEPARNAAPDLFTAIDKTKETSIRLPYPNKKYKIISRQNPTYLATPVTKDGKLSGDAIQIAQPEEFWSASKYLVLVQD
jgi:hypothetical protein